MIEEECASLPKEPAAYQWALPPALEVPPDELQVRLDFYKSCVVMFSLEKGVINTRMVSAADVGLALMKNNALHSGILPPDTLWWAQRRLGMSEVALWRAPRVWPVALQMGPAQVRRFRLPMPGLIFVCQAGSPPRVCAAKRRPWPGDLIYHAPLFNLYHDGTSCAGSHQYPPNVGDIPESFFASFFTPEAAFGDRSQKHPKDLLALWDELDGKRKYPMDDLVPLAKLDQIMGVP